MIARHYEFWPKRIGRSLSVPKTSMYDNLKVSARRYPDKTAIHYYGGSITYRRFQEKVECMAGFMQSKLGFHPLTLMLESLMRTPYRN